MADSLTIWTLDWVPPGDSGPSGFVRDLRLRWACEEAGFSYAVKTVPLKNTTAEHLARQPFGQVPFLDDGEIRMFESGACLLHLARKSEKLMPRDPQGEAETLQWTIAALNSLEMVTVPWWFLSLSGGTENPLKEWVLKRFSQLETVLSGRQWMAAGRFTVADILMADLLRVPKVLELASGFPAIRAYVDRMCSRPAFQKALADQKAHFAAHSE